MAGVDVRGMDSVIMAQNSLPAEACDGGAATKDLEGVEERAEASR